MLTLARPRNGAGHAGQRHYLPVLGNSPPAGFTSALIKQPQCLALDKGSGAQSQTAPSLCVYHDPWPLPRTCCCTFAARI
jgi:hypothetical protein